MLNAGDISADKIKSGLGGYNKKATREYVETIRNEYDSLCKENIELKDKLSVLSEGVQYYKNMEKSLQKALVLAERTTTETVQAAQVKALAMEREAQAKSELLTKEAQARAEACEREAANKADNMIREAKHQVDTAIAKGNEDLRVIHSKIMTLIQQYEQYKAQYKQLALAQMNVLESEAYALEAPILKTLQSALEQPEKEVVSDNTVYDQADDIMDPVAPTFSEREKDEVKEEPEQLGQPEKQVYVDGRGQVCEVHEFREITPSVSPEQDDYFGTPVKEEQNPDEFFKAFETSSKNDAETDSEVEGFGSFEDPMEHEVENFGAFEDPMEHEVESFGDFGETPKKSQGFTSFEEMVSSQNGMVSDYGMVSDDADHMDVTKEDEASGETPSEEEDALEHLKRIERMQMERLRREEEMNTERAKSNRYESFDMTSSDVTSVSDESNAMTQSLEQDEDFLGQLKKADEDGPVTLEELKRKDQEDNNPVPLPKASEEKKYFTDTSSFSGMQAFSFDEMGSSQEEENSLLFGLEHGMGSMDAPSTSGAFKSFKDFESEL